MGNPLFRKHCTLTIPGGTVSQLRDIELRTLTLATLHVRVPEEEKESLTTFKFSTIPPTLCHSCTSNDVNSLYFPMHSICYYYSRSSSEIETRTTLLTMLILPTSRESRLLSSTSTYSTKPSVNSGSVSSVGRLDPRMRTGGSG